MLEIFVYFNNKAPSSHPSCFTLGFLFKIRKNLVNKIRNKSPQSLFFQLKLFPLFTFGIFYVKLSSNTRELNFLRNFALFT